MVTVVTKDGTYYACWEENIQVYDKELSELLVDANNPEAYKTLQDAIAAAKDGSVIRLVAGEYSLGGTLSKNIKIVGPNEGISGYDNRQEEAIINTERVDLASAYLAFDGVKLQGSDNNFIYATTTTQDILIQNCLVDKYNSFIRFEQVAAGGKIAYLNNKITNITQFFLWLKGQNGINVKSIDFIGNMVDTYGSVSTFGMLRVSTTGNDALVINVFDNYFVNPASSNFIFRTASGTMNVKYNTFKGVSNYLVEDSTGQIIFDNNLYLDKDGNVATSVPTGVAGSNVTADENMAVSEDNRALLYNEYVNTLVTYRIKYFANGGSLPEGYNTQRVNGKAELLPFARLTDHYFIGWCLNEDLSDNPFMILPGTLQGNVTVYAKYQEIPVTVYAKFVEATPVESVSIDNKITELKRYETYQLEWSINPSNANIQAVKFESSDTSVATVDNKGLITAVSNGTVTIKMTSLSPSGKTDEFTFEVYSPDHFDINYETNSYVEIGKSILLLADYVKRDGSKVNLVWSSLTPEIASVDAGAVTGLKAGQAVIRVALADDANIYQDFVVTVLDSNLSDALKYVLSAHESNAFLSYDLGIGAGTPAYYRDIVGSVSKLLYNEPLTINDQYYATANANEKNHGGKMSSIEFITVHYTGNMAKGSTASANANYFATNTSTSIHYVTGNDGVFSVLDDSYVAYHAGDGTSVKFEWFPTGVTYKDGDPVYPIFGITANSKFSINGTETTISVPEGTTAATKKVTDSKWINDMGLAFKIVDGQYYMGTTWWCYSQVAEGRICSKGGNLNSIGIESAVNPESNLWYTWQRTAQLVAKLMLENDLDITRVKGHHFYSAKDCPQPLLENDLEIWWKFIEMVEHEYDMLTKYKDYQFTFELDTETTAVNNNGRVVEQPLYTEVVTYTVTIDNGTTSETITLSTIVEGMYCK